MGDNKPKGPRGGESFFAGAAFGLWLAASVALAWLLHQRGAGAALASQGGEVVDFRSLLAAGGEHLQTVTGRAVAVGVVVLGCIPVLLGARGRRALRWYAGAALLTVAAVVATHYMLPAAAAALDITGQPPASPR